jgi:hypothetical protein
MAAKTKSERYGIAAVGPYGLYAGIVEQYDPATKVAVLRQVRQISRWYGKTGGITSLAAFGICGPDARNSRIGAPSPRTEFADVVAVHDCTSEARATLEAATQS